MPCAPSPLLLTGLLCVLCTDLRAAERPQVEVVGLMKNMAVIRIGGNQRLLKVGQVSAEGVELVSADARSVLLRFGGEEFAVSLSRRVGSVFAQPELREARISRGELGHYWVSGTIEGSPVQFMVDTGATLIAMSEHHARNIGIDYRQRGTLGHATTASGVAASYHVKLDSVEVAGLRMSNVDAVVLQGGFPEVILLGMSFLGQVKITEDAGVMVLQQKF